MLNLNLKLRNRVVQGVVGFSENLSNCHVRVVLTLLQQLHQQIVCCCTHVMNTE